MPKRLDTADPGFEDAFKAFLAEKREVSADVDHAVREIIEQVRQGGDKALSALSEKFDAVDLDALGLRVSEAEIKAARADCSDETLRALELARGRIVADPVTGRTGNPRVFAGGDARNGGKEVVNAVAEGKAAAQAIHRSLGGN